MLAKWFLHKCLIQRVALALLVATLSPLASAQQNEMTPFLPLNSTLQLSRMQLEVLWDPQYKKSRVRNKYAIKGLKNQIRELEEKDRKSTSDNTANRQKLLENYMNLAFYELSRKEKSEQSSSEAQEIFRKAARLAELLRENAKSPADKARIGFNEQVAKYYAKLQDFSVAQIDEIGKKIPLATYIQLRLLDAFDSVENGTEAARFAAVKKMEPMGSKMFERQAIVANLLIARTLANLDGEGQFTREPNPSYKTYLTKATELAQSLPKDLKSEVFNYALTVWRVAEREQAAWDSLPIDLNGFKEAPEIPAIRERLAVSLAVKGNFSGAAKAYASIRPLLEKKGLGLKVDDRMVTLFRFNYINTLDPKPYQAALTGLQKKYNSGKIKSTTEITKFLEKLDSFAQELAANEAQKALSQGAKAESRKQALAVLAQRLAVTKQAREEEDIRFKMASLHSLNKDYGSAFTLFYKLGQDAKVSKVNRAKYMFLSLQTKQEQLKWPLDNPFSELDQNKPLDEEQKKQLTELRDVNSAYFEMIKDDKDQSWSVIAHLGVVEARLGSRERAASLWSEQIAKLQPNQIAPYIAGYALRFLWDLQQWEKLEILARNILKKNITPMTMTQQMDAGQMLGSALIRAAQNDLKEKRAAIAVRRLSEYIKNFSKHPQHDEGIFRLAGAYQTLGRHDKALQVMFDLLKQHGESRYAEKVLKGGGSYALGLGLEEDAIRMYELFVEKGAKNSDYVTAVAGLTELYVATNRIDMAEKVLARALKVKELLPEQKNELGARLLDLEARFADPKVAKKAAQFLLKVVPDHPIAAAKINVFEARALLDTPYNPKRMKELTNFLNAQPDRPEELMVEDIAEIRYVVAEKEGEKLLARIEQGGESPLKELESNYKNFKNVEIGFLKVCDTGENSFCAIAQFKLHQLCKKIIEAYSDIDVSEQLTGKKLARFAARKQVVLKDVKDIAGTSIYTALQELEKGNTPADLAQEIKSAGVQDKNAKYIAMQTARFFVQTDINQRDPETSLVSKEKKSKTTKSKPKRAVVKEEVLSKKSKINVKPVVDENAAANEDDSENIVE